MRDLPSILIVAITADILHQCPDKLPKHHRAHLSFLRDHQKMLCIAENEGNDAIVPSRMMFI